MFCFYICLTAICLKSQLHKVVPIFSLEKFFSFNYIIKNVNVDIILELVSREMLIIKLEIEYYNFKHNFTYFNKKYIKFYQWVYHEYAKTFWKKHLTDSMYIWIKSCRYLWTDTWLHFCFEDLVIKIIIIIIIMSCRQHGYPWPSLAISPNRSSPPAGLQSYIPYPHIAAVCMFELVVLLLLGHMWGP